MQIQYPFRALAPSVDGDVLQILGSIRAPLALADLARLIPERSRTGVALAAERLTSQGIVLRDVVGHTRSYRLNDDHLLATAVRMIADSRGQLLDRLKEITGELDASYVALFGSAATGRMTPESDIDILVIHSGDRAPDWDRQLSDAADKITRLTGNEARIVDLHETDLDAPHLTDFIDDVTDEGITLHGEAGQLRSPRNRRRYERSA